MIKNDVTYSLKYSKTLVTLSVCYTGSLKPVFGGSQLTQL